MIDEGISSAECIINICFQDAVIKEQYSIIINCQFDGWQTRSACKNVVAGSGRVVCKLAELEWTGCIFGHGRTPKGMPIYSICTVIRWRNFRNSFGCFLVPYQGIIDSLFLFVCPSIAIRIRLIIRQNSSRNTRYFLCHAITKPARTFQHKIYTLRGDCCRPGNYGISSRSLSSSFAQDTRMDASSVVACSKNT